MPTVLQQRAAQSRTARRGLARSRYAAWFNGVRTHKALSMTEAAKELGVDTSAVSRWEEGTALPMSSLLLRISQWGPVPADKLLTMISEDTL